MAASSETSSSIRTVLAFVDAFNRTDLDAVMSFFREESVYHNIPIAPVKGLEAIRTTIAGFMGMASEIDWQVHHVAESATGAVLTERSDRFLVGDGWIELPVMGTFMVAGDAIVEWRDYFDMKQFRDQLPG